MVQGTTSDAGKSTLVTGLCRVLHRRGWRVAPFKPQNMALNSAVAADGGEIGRAQALQAVAAGIAPTSDMNPILLKPNSDVGAQVIVQGRAIGNLDAVAFHDYKRIARGAVLASHARLSAAYEVILVEGAGSPAEINLRENDIANMGFAEAVDCPVILIADIDRGGVFAHLVGTLALLSESEQGRVKGFVINRFRGDRTLLEPGLRWLAERTGKPVLGVLPFLHGLALDAEDAIDRSAPSKTAADAFRVLVPVLPHISNHTDFEPLRHHPLVDLRYVGPGEAQPAADLVILPGSKNVRSDLEWLRAGRWPQHLNRHLRYGGKVLGICGGFQMLGSRISDPAGLEGPSGADAGLGLLEFETELQLEKQLRNREGRLLIADASIRGYEIHAGISRGPALARPLLYLEDGSPESAPEGALSEDGQVAGTYLHGLFESAPACTALLGWAGLSGVTALDHAERREASIDRLADTLEQYLDLPSILALLGPP